MSRRPRERRQRRLAHVAAGVGCVVLALAAAPITATPVARARE
jgi:hypothetical protein